MKLPRSIASPPFRRLVQVPAEFVEVLVPQLPVRSEPRIEFGQRCGVDRIDAALGIRQHGDKPRLAEDPQVLGRRRLAQFQCIDEFTDCPRSLTKQVESGTPLRIRERHPCCLGHACNMPTLAYACQGMKRSFAAARTPGPGAESRLRQAVSAYACRGCGGKG